MGTFFFLFSFINLLLMASVGSMEALDYQPSPVRYREAHAASGSSLPIYLCSPVKNSVMAACE